MDINHLFYHTVEKIMGKCQENVVFSPKFPIFSQNWQINRPFWEMGKFWKKYNKKSRNFLTIFPSVEASQQLRKCTVCNKKKILTFLRKTTIPPLKINIFERFKKRCIDFQRSYSTFSGQMRKNNCYTPIYLGPLRERNHFKSSPI